MRSTEWLADGLLANAITTAGHGPTAVYDPSIYETAVQQVELLENTIGPPPAISGALSAEHPWPLFPEDAYRRRPVTRLHLDQVPALVVDLATSVQYLRRWAAWCDEWADKTTAREATRYRAVATQLRERADSNDDTLNSLPSEWATEGTRGEGQPQYVPIRLRTA